MQKTENIKVDGTVEKLLDSLINVIGREAVLFEQFLNILERQQKMLIENNVDELSKVTSLLQKIVIESKRLEYEREETVKEIHELGVDETDLTVLKICEMADADRSTQLGALRETVLELYTRIEETRMRNGLLIKQSMEQIQNTVEMIGRIPARKEIYQGKGNLQKEFAPLGVDRRV